MRNYKLVYSLIFALVTWFTQAQTTTENYIKNTTPREAVSIQQLEGLATSNGEQATIVLVGPPTEEEYIASQSITLKPGFSFKATTNSSFHAYITAGDFKKSESIQYFDGLGRLKQTIAVEASPDKKDIVTPVVYDALGRVNKEYLPYVATQNTGNYIDNTTAITGVENYYKSTYPADLNDAYLNPFSEKEFDGSPLNRVMKQAAPGYDWRLNGGHEIEMDYSSNKANKVRLFKVTLNDNYVPNLVSNPTSYYAAGTLYKTITRDENHSGTSKNHTTEEFKDKQGRVVLKRTYNEEEAHDTYYVYDDYGNLTYVIPPAVNASGEIGTDELKDLCYQYQYDHRNRLVEKQLPGKGREFIVYDLLDRPILTKDALNPWLFTKYDVFGRVAYTGQLLASQNGVNRTTMQRNVDTHAVNTPEKLYESRDTNASNHYYSNTAFPTSNYEVLTVNYYDTYEGFNNQSLPTAVYGEPIITEPLKLKGLATGSKVKVLGEDAWIRTISAYDIKGQAIWVYSENEFLDTEDTVETDLDFIGQVLKTKTSHVKGSNAAIVTEDVFTYDHAGRLLDQKQTINGGSEETIVENQYDALGQLESKKVGGGLQTVDYKYNIRGWLKSINDGTTANGDLFGFGINYNTANHGATPLFNGNISETSWKTANDNQERWYAYSYDALNRITSGVDNSNNYSLSSISYDKNGNILDLVRNGHINEEATIFGEMDKLVYSYSGNQLMKVVDNGSKTFGFKDGTNTDNDFSYDINGNMIKDQNKGINTISYNHLNLPTGVSIANSEHNGNISYIYDATGVKLQKNVLENGHTITTDYAGGYVYENDALQFFGQPEGYVKVDGNDYGYVYQYKDHLGNVRLSYTDADENGSISTSEIIEENNYYPFGLKHKGYNVVGNQGLGNANAEKHKYNGIELNESLGLNLYEMELRQYDPAIARWTAIDPVTHHSMSTYTAFDNNPIFWSDPSGADSVNLQDMFDNAEDGITTFDGEGNQTGYTSDEEFINANDDDKDKGNIGNKGNKGNKPSEESFNNLRDFVDLFGGVLIPLGQELNTKLIPIYDDAGNIVGQFKCHYTIPFKALQIADGVLKPLGNLITFVSIANDTKKVINKEIGKTRYGYRMTGTAASMYISSISGGPAGVMAGGTFFLGEILYDNTVKSYHDQSDDDNNPNTIGSIGEFLLNFQWFLDNLEKGLSEGIPE